MSDTTADDQDEAPGTETEAGMEATEPAAPASLPWDGFLVGPENALAQAGVLGLARGDLPTTALVVLHGPSGAGKSRLLRGLVGEWLARRPGSSVAHLEAEAFAAACAEAADRRDGWADLRGRFRTLDLFVLDDLHALERAPLALAELTHTLDALDDSGAAVAVSARTGPGQWRGWPARLVNRLLGGLAVRVDPPSLASRRRYLLDRARARGLRLAADAVEALAAAADGYPTLDGWLARLSLTSRVERRALDRGLVESLLQAEPSGTTATGPTAAPGADAVRLEQVTRAVAGHFGVSLRELRSATRRAAVAGPRHLAMYLARRHTGLSFQAIGRYFGGRDPATARHACRAAADRLAADPGLAAAAAALSRGWPVARGGDEAE